VKKIKADANVPINIQEVIKGLRPTLKRFLIAQNRVQFVLSVSATSG